ncbi:lipid IV(A) 3-deoxy-D-manno-octulosonic acid transferase [Candidatus Curculioniphilus buchneri]|uniref:lipid IV(A) 3-deoxy-D-manno-octulosonic acid transferase n=1 Tax=Candidatus Curculioniphilus buchneri TaxID=690594 RepID=UPI00376ED108
MIIIYNIIIYLIQPFVWIKLLWRSRKIPAYRQRWKERYGFCQGKVKPGGIVLHSVSVGETLASIPLVRILCHRYPILPITITTTTPTASARVLSEFEKDDVHHVYMPYDLPDAIRRFLDYVKPKLVIIMETELWPNLIKELHRRHVLLIIANARLSSRSAAGYKIFNSFIADIMRCITVIVAQNKDDGVRFLELGLQKNQLVVTSNLKFDISITPNLAMQATILRYQWASHRRVWIASSTHKGEEILLLQAHRQLLITFPDLLLILVPRHPERFSVAKEMTIEAGFSYIMRSSGHIPSRQTQVVVGDTMGELMLLYGISDLAFIGGSLVKYGGHNPLEAAAHAIPILMGPHIINFLDICKKLEETNGLITVTNVTSLVSTISILLSDENYRLYYGRHAVDVLHKNKGALQRLLNLIEFYLPRS